MAEKIGLGIITYNRKDFYKQVLNSVPLHKIDHLITINDGEYYGEKTYGDTNVLFHKENKGVGVSKNDALRYLLSCGADHLFLLEDDIIITDENVFEKYIEASKLSGLEHFMYGLHGPLNFYNKIAPIVNLRADYSPTCSIALYPQCVGAFTYYTSNVLKKCGLLDEEFKNAMEHVHHTYILAQNNFTTPFWWFADILGSQFYLKELACSEKSSVIRPRSDWQANIQIGFKLLKEKIGYYPNEISKATENEVIEFLKRKKSNKLFKDIANGF